MSIQSQITRLSGTVTNALTAIQGKGVSTTGKKSDDLATLIGQIPGYTLLGSSSFTVNTTSGTAGAIGTVQIGSSAYTKDKIIYIRVRDKAGKRAGYFFGSDNYIMNVNAGNGTTGDYNLLIKKIYRYNSSSQWESGEYTSTSGYGVYVHHISSAGSIYVYRRYNSTGSLTINGNFLVEVFALDWPGGVSPFA